MDDPLRVLIVEDSNADAQLLVRELQKGGYEPEYERVESIEEMNEALDRQNWDIILSDYVLPHFSGLAALEALKKRGVDTPFVVISGKIGEDVAVETMKAGANDYILKGNLARLVPAIERELKDAVVRRERRQAQEERDRLLEQLRQVNEKLVITSLQMQEKVDEAEQRKAELNTIFDSVSEALVIYDLEGKVSRANSAASQLLGISQTGTEESIAERTSRLDVESEEGKAFPPNEIPSARALRGEVVRGVILSQIRTADNKRIWLSVSAAPIRSSESRILGAVAVFTDITSLHEHKTDSNLVN